VLDTARCDGTRSEAVNAAATKDRRTDRNSGRDREPSAFFPQCLNLLVKPKILADSFRKVIFCLHIADIAPKGERQTVDVGAGGHP